MDVSYFIAGQEVHQPINYPELSIELNYDKDDSLNQAVSLTEFEWGVGSQIDGDDAAKIINDYLTNGDVFEGLPIQIELTHNNTTYTIFDGYLDTSKAIFECDTVIVQGVQKKNIDWINEVFDSKSFDYIYSIEGLVTESDFINVPYVLSSLPDNQEALIATISMVFIIDTIVREIKALSELTAGFAAFPVDAGEIAKFVVSVLYVISLLAFAIMTLRQIINALIQPIKYHTCMSELRHCQRAAQSFGFTFKSSILENAPFNQSYILPEKYNQSEYEDEDKLTGVGNDALPGTGTQSIKRLGNRDKDLKSKGYFNGTVGDWFREMKKKYNAKLIIDGDILRLERRDYDNISNKYIIPSADQEAFTLNSDELKSNYVIRFATDTNDKNTIQRYSGNTTQVITRPIAGRTEYTLLSKLEEVSLSFSRATTKTELTNAEKIVKFYLNIADLYVNFYVGLVNIFILVINTVIETLKLFIQVLSLFGINIPEPSSQIPYIKWVNLSSKIDDRLGMLLMENDFVDVPKNFILDVDFSNARNTKINSNSGYEDIVYTNSLHLYNNFHFIQSFVPTSSKPNANQYKLFEKSDIPFCFDDYELVRNTKYIQDDESRSGELLSLRWNIYRQTSDMKYKVSELYTNKLTEEKITPNGR